MIQRIFHNKMDQQSEAIWLTIYADLMTNLLLVFLALYGLTVMGQEAVQKAVASMKGAKVEYQGVDLNFETLAPLLKEQFSDSADIAVTEAVGAVRIEFGESVLFESGRAVLKPDAIEKMKKVARYLKSISRTVVVEGHSDSIPLKSTGRYKDNWELSLARAMAVVDVLIKEGGMPADQLAAAAYGPYRPRASNTSTIGRRINRRVEIALFQDFGYDLKEPQ